MSASWSLAQAGCYHASHVKNLPILVLSAVGLVSSTVSAQSVPGISAAVDRALPMLQRSAGAFVARRSCVSCHHNVLPILTLNLARERGFAIDTAVLAAVEGKTFRELRGPDATDAAVQAVALSDPTPNDSFLLMAAHAAGLEPSLTTAVYARRILGWQRAGHWVTSDFRPPHSSSLFTATATAVRAIGLYGPEEMRALSETSVRAAQHWLSATRPASTEDASFRLMGLVWAGASQEEIGAARRDLLAFQKKAGGWPQLPGHGPDVYSTGEALFALHEAGMPPTDATWRGGLRFVLSTQASDGTWHVKSRMISPAMVSPPYFPTGFPYGKDEFLSYAGSSWAVLALLCAVPQPAVKPQRLDRREPGGSKLAASEPWARTALFGTAERLASWLDRGLDPNSQTRDGTTVLMMAAPDAAKVALLLARGADARRRTASGCDALTIAASYRGTTAAMQALIDAGAEAQASPGVHARHSPLVFASMTGDVDNVALLLAHGANPSEGASPQADTPIAAAVTFGHVDVVRLLVSAGAHAGITENSGINLLHWATITNRSAVVPALVEAGVPLNARDDSGFTPLMYAATIDFGDTETLTALVKAGADKTIRNNQGRTASEQAHHYGHARLEAALR
jgi:ankyrin repeat protein